jgi:hypothetical protein
MLEINLSCILFITFLLILKNVQIIYFCYTGFNAICFSKSMIYNTQERWKLLNLIAQLSCYFLGAWKQDHLY